MLTNKRREILIDGAEKLAIALQDIQIEQFGKYLDLIETYNKKFNLTRITGDEAIEGHFLDALSVVMLAPELKKQFLTVLDLGSGVGVPGIPLAIAFPQLQVTLLDATAKRVGFLDFVIDNLGLQNTKAICARAEQAAIDANYSKKFDIVISRAFVKIETLIEFSKPFTKDNGKIMALISSPDALRLKHEFAHEDGMALNYVDTFKDHSVISLKLETSHQ